jgi:hypothetical protein
VAIGIINAMGNIGSKSPPLPSPSCNVLTSC